MKNIKKPRWRLSKGQALFILSLTIFSVLIGLLMGASHSTRELNLTSGPIPPPIANINNTSPTPMIVQAVTPTPTQTTVPTPTPTPPPTPVPTPPPTPVPTVIPAPVVLYNELVGPGLNVGVGVYSDCTGLSPLGTGEAFLDICIPWDNYFVGHNYGVFTPILNWGIGTQVTYWDGSGVAHKYTIEGSQIITNWIDPVPPAGTVAQFQTCTTPAGVAAIIFWAVSG